MKASEVVTWAVLASGCFVATAVNGFAGAMVVVAALAFHGFHAWLERAEAASALVATKRIDELARAVTELQEGQAAETHRRSMGIG